MSTSKKKLCIVSLKAYPLFNKNCNGIFGGAEVQLYLLAQALSKHEDLDISFIVADYGGKKIEMFNEIKIIKSFRFEDNALSKNLKFLNSLLLSNSNIFVQRTLDPASGILSLICRIRGAKFIYMVAHDNETNGLYEKNIGFLKRLLANAVFKFSDLVIVQNVTQKELLLKNKNRTSFLIKSGYFLSKFTPSKKSELDYVLWVSRSKKWKQPEIFIQLASCNPKFQFKMICPKAFDDTDEWYNHLKQKAGNVFNLEFIEFVPFDEIDIYFRNASIFVNTSLNEGFPNTYIQATKNGTPILSLNVNPDNFLDEYSCGYFCNNEFDKLNEKLNLLIGDVTLHNKMSKNAYEYAVENHNIMKSAEQLYNLFTGLK
ncbi:Glycosyltransferase [Methanosarcina sp. MTP4]|uniref:glycosyltransferase family 4 protein n=1 Tax=Methanosarcina sp. MTP4 TaxID=1434100 RepID=UPI0006154EA3|nr:glycosyltransferase [Methanosarcina sp. MTP4]AKB24333.1 Glycosyltransferase [Methanosarcina sp. MTP4]